MNYTPENIIKLNQNEIFVFGSNLAGKHNGGGAKLAVEKFGAVYGQAIGIQGQSYAIPTLDHNFQKISLDEIHFYIKNFIYYAFINPQKTFFVTKIGCGIAGYSPIHIAPLFGELPVTLIRNIILPKEFADIQNNACV